MLASAEFWVAVAFVIFWGVLFYYGVPGTAMSSLDRRSKRIANELAEARIAQAESQASAEVRAAAVEAAIRASERVLREQITGPAAASLLTESLGDVRRKLQ
jgi:F-type H+-transporting ATPase subunit b